MYVRSKLLWWHIPIFLSLFFVGIALGKLGEPDRNDGRVAEQSTGSGKEPVTLSLLLDQLTKDEERSFVVFVHNQALNGRYQHEQFELSGEMAGHQVNISRNGEQKVNVLLDGQPQEQTASLPYALYTPYEHAALIKSVLQSVTPEPVQDPSGQGWRGFRLSVPQREVTSLLSLWLGPAFASSDWKPELAKGIGVTYELWYEPDSGLMKQMDMELQIKTAVGDQREELRFRL